MTAPVDVLAVMDALVESSARVAAGGTVTADPHTVEVAKRTRAAIAELIEASKDVEWYARMTEPYDTYHEVGRKEMSRLTTALVRVGGGK